MTKRRQYFRLLLKVLAVFGTEAGQPESAHTVILPTTGQSRALKLARPFNERISVQRASSVFSCVPCSVLFVAYITLPYCDYYPTVDCCCTDTRAAAAAAAHSSTIEWVFLSFLSLSLSLSLSFSFSFAHVLPDFHCTYIVWSVVVLGAKSGKPTCVPQHPLHTHTHCWHTEKETAVYQQANTLFLSFSPFRVPRFRCRLLLLRRLGRLGRFTLAVVSVSVCATSGPHSQLVWLLVPACWTAIHLPLAY